MLIGRLETEPERLARLAHDPTSDRPRIFEEQGDGSLRLVPTIGVRWRF